MRLLIATFLALLLAVSGDVRAGEQRPAVSADDPAEVVVYKSPYCGCCVGWARHMTAHGYAVSDPDNTDLEAVKQSAGVPRELYSCHTAVIDGYVIEGHVPASAIERLLRERPDVKGLAVPGMPIGSPGMEGPDPEPYDVLSFDEDGETSVFMSVPAGD